MVKRKSVFLIAFVASLATGCSSTSRQLACGAVKGADNGIKMSVQRDGSMAPGDDIKKNVVTNSILGFVWESGKTLVQAFSSADNDQ